jgi:HD-like signal output (HDOD) protein
MQLSAGNASLSELASLVQNDPALAMRVLQLANSALFAKGEELRSVRHAVAYIGLGRLRAISATVGVQDFLGNGHHAKALRPAWRHSLATALVCKEISLGMALDTDEAYTAGLLHDVGRLALIRTHPTRHDVVIAKAQSLGLSICECEKEWFHFDHCEAGEWLLRESALSTALQAAAARHHHPLAAQVRGLPDLVRLASVVADVIDFACHIADARASEAALTALQPLGASGVHDLAELTRTVWLQLNEMECYLL